MEDADVKRWVMVGLAELLKKGSETWGVNLSDSIRQTIRADSIVSPIGALIRSIFDPIK